MKAAALAVALAWAVGLAGCARQQAAASNGGPDGAPLTPVMAMDAKVSDVPIYSEYPAQTYARNTVDVRGRVDGYIEKWLFRPGQEVRAGDVLYVLDLRPYEAALEQARGNLTQTEADLEFALNQVALLQAEANLAAAQANLIKAQQD